MLDPLKLVIDNYPGGQEEECVAPNHPQKPELGKRAVPFSRELWIEREDFMEAPPKGYFRLFPGNKVRLRYGFVVEVHRLRQGCRAATSPPCIANYFPDSKSGTPGADNYKVKGNIHWVSAQARLRRRSAALRPPVRRRRTRAPADRDFLADINPDSKNVITAQLEAGAARMPQPEERFQFERHGYFVADRVDSQPGAPVFNRAVTLKDSWGGGAKITWPAAGVARMRRTTSAPSSTTCPATRA